MSRMNQTRGITGRQKQRAPSVAQAQAALAIFLGHNRLSEQQIDELADDHAQANFDDEGAAAFGCEE